MVTVTQDQLMKRWDALPPDIRDALLSEPNSEFLWKVCGNEHIPPEKIYDAAECVSYVLFGFLHPGDLADELAGILGVNKQVAGTIADAVNKRIFDPLKGEIDEAYEPPSSLGPVPMPKLIDEIRKPPTPPIASIPIPTPPPAVPRPSPLSSTMSPPSPTTAGGPAPAILQEETEFKPLRQPSGFGINVPMQKSLDAKPEKEKIPMKPAFLEFGGQPAPKPSPSAEAADGKPRIVHYSEFRTPLDSSTNAGEAKPSAASPPKPPSAQGRDIQEITAAQSSAPPPPASFGSTAREMSKPLTPQPVVPPAPMPKTSTTPAPKMSDVLLNEKELPAPVVSRVEPPPPSPPTNTERNRPIPPPIPPRPPQA